MAADIGDLIRPRVSVIIATMATLNRAKLLVRAVQSIRDSSILPIRTIVVVNGKKFDHQVCEWLRDQPDIHFEYREKPSSPKAIAKGRTLVTTEFFATLDDDDEYLNLATDIRMRAMDSEPKADLLVTNGYRMVGDCDALVYSDLSRVSAEPLVNLMSFNWLSSCNALYRTASVDLKYFEDSHPYGEWTWLAFKLAIDHKVIISIEAPTFRIHDTVASLSKSDAYFEAYEQLFNRMLGLGPPREVVRLVRQKLGAQYHAYAAASTKKGDRIGALKWHLRSLAMPGGFRYLSFSRHLLSSYP